MNRAAQPEKAWQEPQNHRWLPFCKIQVAEPDNKLHVKGEPETQHERMGLTVVAT
jgi:hypothetical protein